jgi:hypothetical protein
MSTVRAQQMRSMVEPVLTMFLVTALLLLASGPFTGKREDLSLLLGWGIVFLGALPMVIQLWNGRLPVYPLFAMTGMFTGVTYGLTPLFLDWSPVNADAEQVVRMQAVVIYSLTAAYLGYSLIGSVFKQNRNAYPGLSRCTLGQLQMPAWALLVITELLETLSVEGTKETLRLTGEFARVILYLLAFRPSNVTVTKVAVFALLIPYDLFMALLSGFTAPILIVGLYIFAGYYYWRRKVPWILVMVGLAVYFALSPIKHMYREVVWYSDASRSASSVEKFGTLVDSGRHLPTQFIDSTIIKAAISRFDHLDTLARIATDTPGSLPYLYGETIWPVVYKPIPRLLWPDKPQELLSNEWAHRYGLLNPLDTETSFNLPWICELYMNFGTLGCVIGMFLFGLLFCVLERHYFSQRVAPIPYAIGITVCVMLWYAESNISLVWGGVPIAMAYIYLMAKILTVSSPPKRGTE